jgi:hypothetical protein
MMSAIPSSVLRQVLGLCDTESKACLRHTCKDMNKTVLVSRTQVALDRLLKMWNYIHNIIAKCTSRRPENIYMSVTFGTTVCNTLWWGGQVMVEINNQTWFDKADTFVERFMDDIIGILEARLMVEGQEVKVKIMSEVLTAFHKTVITGFQLPTNMELIWG